MDLIEENVRRLPKDYGNEAVAVFQGTGRAATLYAPATAYAALQTPNAGSTLAGESCLRPALRRGELHSGGRLSRARLCGVLP